MTTLPKELELLILETISKEKSCYDVVETKTAMYGAQVCYNHLLKSASEFDEGKALEEWAQLDAGRGETWDWVDGARKQHSQLAAMIAARDAEIERMRHSRSFTATEEKLYRAKEILGAHHADLSKSEQEFFHSLERFLK